MSRKAMKPPIGTHTPQAMLLAAGVSFTKVLFTSQFLYVVYSFSFNLCACVCTCVLFDKLDKLT